MALQPDPYAPWSWIPPEWDTASAIDPSAALPDPTVQQFALPGELAKADPSTPPPPPPPPPQRIGPAPGAIDPNAPPPWAMQHEELAAPALPPPADEVQAPAPALPPMQADAISGGALPTQEVAQQQVDATGAPAPWQTNEDTRPLLPDEPSLDDRVGALVNLAETDPAAYIKQNELANQKLRDQQLAEETRIAREDAQREQENSRLYQESIRRAQAASQQLEADAAAVGTMRIDNNRFFHESTARNIFSGIAGIVGALAASANGGRNVGWDIVTKAQDDDIASQVAAIQNEKDALDKRRGLVGDLYAQSGDLFRAQETARIAMREQGIRQLEIEMQKFDPQGTTARRIAAQIVQAKAQSAAMKQKFAEAEQKRQLEILKAAQEQQKIDHTEKNDRAQIGLGYSRIAQDERQSKRSAELEQKKIDADLQKASQVQADKEEKEMRELGVAAPPAASIDADGKLVLTKSTGYLKNADGSNWKVPTDTEAKEFRAKKSAADGIISILDDIRDIRDKVGGESSWGNSPEYGRLQVLKQNLVMLKKAGTQGMSSDADMARIETALGADNPASFRSQAAKLDEGRAQVEKQLDIAARALHYTGDPITYPDPLKMPKAAKTPEQEQVEAITAFDPKRSLTTRDYSDLGIDVTRPEARGGGLNTMILQALEKEGGIPPSIKRQIDALRSAQQDADPKKREFAVEALQNIASNALDPNVKAYATANAFDPAAIAAPATSRDEEPR